MIINEEEFKALIQEAVEAALEKSRVKEEEPAMDPIEEEHIEDATEAKYREKCAEEGVNPDTGLPIPEWTHDEFRKEHLMPLLKSQPDPTEATAKAKAVIKDMFDVDKFGEIPVEDLHATFEAIREAL